MRNYVVICKGLNEEWEFDNPYEAYECADALKEEGYSAQIIFR